MTEIIIETIPLAHYYLWVLLSLGIAYECFITSHQQHKTLNSSWLNYKLLYKMASIL